MMHFFLTLLLLLSLALMSLSHAQTNPSSVPCNAFVNDICMPSTLWMLSGVQNDLFVQPILKRWRPYDDFVRFRLAPDAPFLRRLSTVASITEPVDGSVLTTELVNGDEFAIVKELQSTIRVGQPGVGDTPVTAQLLGDSYTQGTFFRHALLESGYVPNLRLVGLLKCADGQYNEGRGGWRLANYFAVPTQPVQCYHGFMQPSGDARYWGATQFWRNAWQCFRQTAPKGFEPYYSCGRFDDVLPRFDEATGFLLHPTPGDVQFDNDRNAFVRFDGASWQPVDSQELSWDIDYSKYLAMWDIPQPDFLFVMLGLNDFCHHLQADFTEWGKRITRLRESYQKACPDGKFVICIPCSTCGSLDNAEGNFTLRQNAAMWRFRKWLIDNFDRREQEGFYLVDVGITIDNEYGYHLTQSAVTIPYEQYSGKDTLRVQAGTPHPYANYPSMGLPIAAFIQAHRR
ncbi:MAG: SGNH/GDSL hydrolase family protein [Victivallales bacterium]|nr:SGNH/GDSL hydrolase family protein [Victivallales bacterium]